MQGSRLTNVVLQNVRIVGKWAKPLLLVVLEIPRKGLSQQVLHIVNILLDIVFWKTYQAMQMVQAFHMCRISTSVFLLDFYLIRGKTRFSGLLVWYSRGMV